MTLTIGPAWPRCREITPLNNSINGLLLVVNSAYVTRLNSDLEPYPCSSSKLHFIDIGLICSFSTRKSFNKTSSVA